MAMTKRRFGRTTAVCVAAATLIGTGATIAWTTGASASGKDTVTASVAPAAKVKKPKTSTTPTVGWDLAMPVDSPDVVAFDTGSVDGLAIWNGKKRVCIGERQHNEEGPFGDWLPEWCATPGIPSVPELSSWTFGDGGVIPVYRLLLLPRKVVSGHLGGNTLQIHDLGNGIKAAMIADGTGERMVLHDKGGMVIADRPLTSIVRGGTWFKIPDMVSNPTNS
jgi:hypothetical protein